MKIPAKYRKFIYIGTTVLMSAFIAFGLLSTQELTDITNSIVALIGALATLLAAFNVTPDE